MDFRLLGPVEVGDGDGMLPVGSGRERFVLAVLLLQADRLTSAASLIEALWSEPPATARAQVHNIVSSLRRRLRGPSDELIVTRPLGYELKLGSHRLDVHEFRRLAAAGRQALEAGDHERASALFAQGLARWRGPALADVAAELGADIRHGLHEERIGAAESRLTACLALRRFDEVLAEVTGLIADHPYRESLRGAELLALVGVGRRADALAAYQAAHRLLADELGVEPGASLRRLHQAILRGDDTSSAVVAVAAPPRQLPPSCTVLTGRDKLVTEIRDEFGHADAPVAVLVGAGGVGKTTVALAVAHRLRRTYADGHLYADLRGSRDEPADPHVIAGQFLRAFGVGGSQLPDDPQERIALYRTRLAGSRVLVVLDDAGSETQVRPLLPGAPGCGAVVTSRRQLGALVGAARWTIPMLEPSAAVELLGRIVGADRVAAEPETATTVVELCGGLPLAVCVAAARLATRSEWTMTDLRQRLHKERHRLDELVIGDLDVRAGIGLSYQALSPEARMLLRRLGSLDAPDWPDWTPQALLDLPAGAAEPLLDELIDVHLVEPLGRDGAGQRRYRLHQLVADFGRERALAEDSAAERRDAVARALSRWLALAAGAAGAAGAAEPPGWFAWFDAERSSLVAAVGQACRCDLAEIAGELALAMSGFLTARAMHDDLERTVRAATACAREHCDDELLLRLLGALFAVCLRREPSELSAIADEELRLARRLGDRRRELGALANAGWAARKLGRLPEAVDRLQRAIATATPDMPSRLVTRALNGLALTYREAGRFDDAVPLTERAVSMERAGGTPRITAISLVNHAAALVDAGLLADAEHALAEAAEITGATGDGLVATDVDLVRAEIEMRRGSWTAARRRLDQHLRFLEAHADWAGAADVLRALGDLAHRRNRPCDAIEPLRRSLTIWRRLGARLEEARVLARLDQALAATDDPGAAAECRRRCRTILADLELDDASLRLPTR